jgi:hypothetical protein
VATIPLIFPTQSNPGRFSANGSARLINLFRERQGGEGTVDTPLHAVSGLSLFSTLSGGGIRAALAVDNYLYVVAGRLLFRVDINGASVQIGAIPTDGPVYMGRNRAVPTQIGIVSAGQFWVLVGTTLTQNADLDLPAASSFAVLDGYGVLPGYGNQWYITDTDDFTSIDALDFASAESSPDAIKRVAVRENELVFFGADTLEWWRNTGETFPFGRITAKRIGCLSAGSVTRFAQTLAWVATDEDDNIFVAAMNGYDAQRISTHAVERAIRDDANRDSITATSWGEDGHTFLALTGTDWTWVYDKATGLWHERQSYGTSKWRCNNVVAFAGKLIACDASEAKLYEMHRDYYDEAGTPLIVTIVTPTHHVFPDRMQVNKLHVKAVMGQGATPGDDTTTDPQVTIRVSRDGGSNWGPQRSASLGVDGERNLRIVERRWGRPFDDQGATFELSASAAVARGFLDAAMDAKRLPG